jgi:hypothetical protein
MVLELLKMELLSTEEGELELTGCQGDRLIEVVC